MKALYLTVTMINVMTLIAKDFNVRNRITPGRMFLHIIAGALWLPAYLFLAVSDMLKEMGFVKEQYKPLRKEEKDND